VLFAYSIRKLVSFNETLATGGKPALQREDEMRCARSHALPAVIASRKHWTWLNALFAAADSRVCERAR